MPAATRVDREERRRRYGARVLGENVWNSSRGGQSVGDAVIHLKERTHRDALSSCHQETIAKTMACVLDVLPRYGDLSDARWSGECLCGDTRRRQRHRRADCDQCTEPTLHQSRYERVLFVRRSWSRCSTALSIALRSAAPFGGASK